MSPTMALATALVMAGVAVTTRRLAPGGSIARRVSPRRSSATRRGRSLPGIRSLSRLRSQPTPGARAVADWCDEVGRELRAGVGIRTAIATTDSTDRHLTVALRPMQVAAARGAALADALSPSPTAGPHLELAYVVLATVHRHGGAPALAIDRAAAALRQRAADADERSVHAAQARMSGRVLTVLPLAILAVLTATDGAVRQSLFTPFGSLSLVCGVALNIGGWAWINRLTRTSP